ncbi:MAG: hypothetical protein WCO29_18875 [Nostocales cyanobacterium ELA583]|jgi:hypothetical protein
MEKNLPPKLDSETLKQLVTEVLFNHDIFVKYSMLSIIKDYYC